MKNLIGESIDQTVSAAPSSVRALVAIGTVFSVAFSLGVVAGTWGIREDVAQLRQQDEQLASQDARLSADISSNRSEVAGLRLIIEQTDLARMAMRVARMDRELCLMRADAAGIITPQMQQECASR